MTKKIRLGDRWTHKFSNDVQTPKNIYNRNKAKQRADREIELALMEFENEDES